MGEVRMGLGTSFRKMDAKILTSTHLRNYEMSMDLQKLNSGILKNNDYSLC